MSNTATESNRKTPTLRQQQVLDAFYDTPSAAAVARSMKPKISAKQVGRIVQEFGYLLVERREAQNAELELRSSARIGKLQDWIDEHLGRALERLGQIAEGDNDQRALSAIKLMFELASVVGLHPGRVSGIDAILAEKEREVEAQLAALHGDGGGDDARSSA